MGFRHVFIGFLMLYVLSGCTAVRVLKTNARLIAKHHSDDPEAIANAALARSVGRMPDSTNGLLNVGIGIAAAAFPAAGAVLKLLKDKSDAIALANEVAPLSETEAHKRMVQSKVKV